MACTPPVSPCVDFVVVGEADCTGGLSFADVGTSLLNHNPSRAHVRPVLLTSNHAKKQHFYLRHATGTLCSTALTSGDIAWMEQTSGLEAGALFEAFKHAASAGAATVSELSWEPTERWLQLPREVRRSRRGEKSVEHLANLRRSDPLINAFAWRDLAEEQRRVEDSPFARLNQQARILRGIAEHRLLTRLLLERMEKGAQEEEVEVAKMAARKAGAPGLRERHSNDTVLDLDLGLGCSREQQHQHDLDELDELELGLGSRLVTPALVAPAGAQLGPGGASGDVSADVSGGDYSPKSVVPGEPSFIPPQAHAKVLGEAMGKGAYAEADRGFGYSLASS